MYHKNGVVGTATTVNIMYLPTIETLLNIPTIGYHQAIIKKKLNRNDNT